MEILRLSRVEGNEDLGMDNVTVSVDVNGSAGSLEKGKGAMLVTGNGVAGSLEGKLSSGGANFAVG